MSLRVAGEAFSFARMARETAFPEPWRELDRAVWRWTLAHGGDATVAEAAGWASCADGQAHAALPLTQAAARGGAVWTPQQWQALRSSPLVASTGDAAHASRPFLLEGEHFYLRRNHRSEAAVASALGKRRRWLPTPQRPLDDAELRALFDGSWSDAEERQRAAVQQVIGRRLMVLAGGPGTGKTTTVLRMLLGLSREHLANIGTLPTIRMAAPTGKAARRLGESIRHGGLRLQAGDSIGEDAWALHLRAVREVDAVTLHRLLGSRGAHGGFEFHAGQPLPADIVVIDEASMLDLGMLHALLDALREDAVLVLVGDADQLTSVGTGSIMIDIVQALEADPRGDLVRLEHCFRADAALVPINAAVRCGDAAAFDAAFAAADRHTLASGLPAAVRHPVVDGVSLRRKLTGWAGEIRMALEAVGIADAVAGEDVDALLARLAVLRQRQLLCALRDGPFGAVQVAAALATQLRGWDALVEWKGRSWYPGRSVMIARNDHAARLYNGDVGLCVRVKLEGKALLQVAFDPSAEDVAAGRLVRLLDPQSLPLHEDAFALTVHKSQGSEYARVALLLPPDAASPLLLRQMLYTGLSRARDAVELWSTEASTRTALATALRRHGRLQERLLAASTEV